MMQTVPDKKETQRNALFRCPTWKALFVVLLLVFVLLMALYPPQFINLQLHEWQFLIVFGVTIVATIQYPEFLPLIVLLTLGLGCAAGLLSLEQTLAGYSNQVTWMVVTSLLLGQAVTRTGLGKRIALGMIQAVGKTPLRLAYTLAITDLFLAPFIPSNTARGGGILLPLAKSLATELDSLPGNSSRRLGGYLVFTSFQVLLVTSTLFVSANAINGLTTRLASQATGVTIYWHTWFLAAALPGCFSLVAIPLFILWLYPPELRDTSILQAYARKELEQMGSTQPKERILVCLLLILLLVWATSPWHHLNSLTPLVLTIAILVLMGILQLKNLFRNGVVWLTFIWFGGMLSLAEVLSKNEALVLLSNTIHMILPSDKYLIIIILVIIYSFSHYAFAGITSQIIAFFIPFLATALAAGAAAVPVSLAFCFFSNLYASTTVYGSAPAVIYFGSGYIDKITWLRVGFFILLFHLLIWLGIGLPWWTFLGETLVSWKE